MNSKHFCCIVLVLIILFWKLTIQTPGAFVRLVGGKTQTEGRLEISHNNEWGTVCDDFFGRKAASVVCRMLELPSSGAFYTGAYEAGIGRIWLDNVKCIGNEASIDLCEHNGFGENNCDHDEDVGVVCTDDAIIRLAEGKTHSEGRLELFLNNEWGTVCNHYFDRKAASVVCRMLELPSSGAFSTGVYGAGSDRIWLDRVKCIGNEPSIDFCEYYASGENGCDHNEDVGVVCTEDELVQLVDGKTPTEGRLEIFHNNEWGTVCNHYFDIKAASVVCTMLELPSSGAFYTGAYGAGSGRIWLDDVKCIGNEASIDLCEHDTFGENNCDHDEDVGVVCTDAIDWKARLVHGYSPSNGRVQVYVNDTWKSVCGSHWGSRNSDVFCRMLGLDNVIHATVFPVNRRLDVEHVTIAHLSCSGTETSFEHCNFPGVVHPGCTNCSELVAYCISECPLIQNCKNQTCTDEERAICNECEDDFNLTTDKQRCQMIQQPYPTDECPHNCKTKTSTDKDISACEERGDNLNLTKCREHCQMNQQICPTVYYAVLIVGLVCAAFLLNIITIMCLCSYFKRRQSEGKPTSSNDQNVLLQQVPRSLVTSDDEARHASTTFTEGSDPSPTQSDSYYDIPNVYEELQNRRNTEHLYDQS